MIEIIFNENLENPCHNDIKIIFNFADIVEVGDSYHFAGVDEDKAYKDVHLRVVKYYQKSFDKLKHLFVGRSLFWFYHIFDESDNGLLITNTDNTFFAIQFCTKCKYSSGEEYIFLKEIYIVNKELFLSDCEKLKTHPN